MNPINSENHEYYILLHSAKPKTAAFLHEKFHYWKEVTIPKVREKLIKELEKDRNRLLYIRILSSVLNNYTMEEKTGCSFGNFDPGIEYATNGEQTFDIYIKGSDGSALFVLFIQDQNVTISRIVNTFKMRFDFIHTHEQDLRKLYSIQGKFRFALLLHERERGHTRQAIQTIGRMKDMTNLGEVHVIELILEDYVLHGFPAIPRNTPSSIPLPESYLFYAPPLDLQAHDYHIFEHTFIHDCYAQHLMEHRGNPKFMNHKEVLDSFLRMIGFTSMKRGDQTAQKRKDFARKKISQIIDMGLRFNLIEESDDKAGDTPRSEDKSSYRLVCAGTDLPTVQKNLFKKYLDAASEEEASTVAQDQAVKEYRRRYPRINGRF